MPGTTNPITALMTIVAYMPADDRPKQWVEDEQGTEQPEHRAGGTDGGRPHDPRSFHVSTGLPGAGPAGGRTPSRPPR